MDEAVLEQILQSAPKMKILVLGDYFLDHYLYADSALDEVSRETGLTAYQVTRVQSSPGAAGTVVNNLHALGVGTIYAIGVIGRDGYGYQLKQGLLEQNVKLDGMVETALRVTPAYIKPMYGTGESYAELNRLDIKNWHPLEGPIEEDLIHRLRGLMSDVDAVLVMDQVEEDERGAITTKVRGVLADEAKRLTGTPVLVDSRSRIGEFRNVMLKPNQQEALAAVNNDSSLDIETAAKVLYSRVGRPVFVTLGNRGQLVHDGTKTVFVPAFDVDGPTDPVGAGDSVSASMAVALCAGQSAFNAAVFGNLTASVTVAKIGTTGTASPQELRNRCRVHQRRD